MAWTSPRTWVAGETVTAALLNTHVRDNQLELNGTASAWTSFSPTWTAGASVTLSSALGRYKQVGKIVHVQLIVIASAVAASGLWKVGNLPVSIRDLGSTTPLGTVTGQTSTYFGGTAYRVSATEFQILQHGNPTGTPTTVAVAINNAILADLMYEAA